MVPADRQFIRQKMGNAGHWAIETASLPVLAIPVCFWPDEDLLVIPALTARSGIVIFPPFANQGDATC
jgi:hypothetical protein